MPNSEGPLERSWPLPTPMGWYSAGYSDEFSLGRVEGRRFVGRELIVWRDLDGVAQVSAAFCPHLGAHLAVGGCVKGRELVCPFHEWRFDATGTNTSIPYAERTNAKARLRAYPTIERNGMVMFWFHPDSSVEPKWDIPELEAVRDGQFLVRDEWIVETAWQEIAENAVDGAHFQFVHGTSSPGTVVSADFSGPVRSQRVAVEYNTAQGPLEGWQESTSYGPGFGVVQFHIFGDAWLITANTPIERDRTQVRFAWVFADDAISRRTGPKFAEEVRRQFNQDIPIWEHKAFIASPALAPSEKAITQFRALSLIHI